jgi:DNA modification methylase
MSSKVLQGDARAVLDTLPASSVHLCVTRNRAANLAEPGRHAAVRGWSARVGGCREERQEPAKRHWLQP